jgi:hypothetical protein
MEKEFKPLYFQSKGRDTSNYVSVIEKDGKKIKIDFGYKINPNKKPERLFLFIDFDFNFTQTDKNFIEQSNLLLTRHEWIVNFKFFSEILEKDLAEIEI